MGIMDLKPIAEFLRKQRKIIPFESTQDSCMDEEAVVTPIQAKLALALEWVTMKSYAEREVKGENRDFSSAFSFAEGWRGDPEASLHFPQQMAFAEWGGTGPGNGDYYDLDSIFYEFGFSPDPFEFAFAGASAIYESGDPKGAILKACMEGIIESVDGYNPCEWEDYEESEEGNGILACVWMYRRLYDNLPKEVEDCLEGFDATYYEEVLDKVAEAFGWPYGLSDEKDPWEKAFLNMALKALQGTGNPYVASFSSEKMGQYLRETRPVLGEGERCVMDGLFYAATLLDPGGIGLSGPTYFEEGSQYRSLPFYGMGGMVGPTWFEAVALPNEGTGSVFARCACAVFHFAYEMLVKDIATRKKEKAADAV